MSLDAIAAALDEAREQVPEAFERDSLLEAPTVVVTKDGVAISLRIDEGTDDTLKVAISPAIFVDAEAQAFVRDDGMKKVVSVVKVVKEVLP